MTEPNDNHKQEARERIWLLRNEDGSLDDCWQMSTLSNTQDVEYVRGDILSSRNREIREVLEGLVMRTATGYCWCRSELNLNITGNHEPRCLAARGLYDKLNSTD